MYRRVILGGLISFFFSASQVSIGHADVFDDVPAAEGYELLYALDLSPTGNYLRAGVPYEVDNRADWDGNFDRVAYYLRLVRPDEPPQFIFVSGTTFTRSGIELGIPLHDLGFTHQTAFSDLTVESNVEGIVTGDGLRGGHVEMWPGNYSQGNAAGVPNASNAIYDFGDQLNLGAGYGSFQVHNFEARQTLFAYNRWNDGAAADLGIGNNTIEARGAINTDWTFRGNGNEYSERRLEVLVRPGFPPPPATIELSAPQPCSVVQRRPGNQAVVTFRGRSEVPADNIYTRFEPEDDEEPGEWVPFAVPEEDGTFEGRLTLPGGWHAVQIRSTLDDVPVGQITARGVGVGEVFIIAGQSNSANHGDPVQTPEDPRVCATDGQNWQRAVDPQPIATGNGGSPWPALGDLLAARFDVPIGFLSVGWGGTSVEQWLPGNARNLFPRLQRATNALGVDGARAVLWHQGESNAARRTSAEDYAAALTTVIESIREHAGWSIPWGVARASFLPRAPEEGMLSVVAGQNAVIADVDNVFAGPTTDDLIGVDWRSDTVHFNEAGLREHGRRWAEVIELPQCQGLPGVIDVMPCAEPMEPDAGAMDDAGALEDAGGLPDADISVGDAGMLADAEAPRDDAEVSLDMDVLRDAQPRADVGVMLPDAGDAMIEVDQEVPPAMDATGMVDMGSMSVDASAPDALSTPDGSRDDALISQDMQLETDMSLAPDATAMTSEDAQTDQGTERDIGDDVNGSAESGCDCAVSSNRTSNSHLLWLIFLMAYSRRRIRRSGRGGSGDGRL